MMGTGVDGVLVSDRLDGGMHRKLLSGYMDTGEWRIAERMEGSVEIWWCVSIKLSDL